MAEIKETRVESIELERGFAMFRRGRDILTLKVYRRIFSKDEFCVWYVQDFKDLGGSDGQVRAALAALEGQGCIKKIKSYPVFWKKEAKL